MASLVLRAELKCMGACDRAAKAAEFHTSLVSQWERSVEEEQDEDV